MNSESWQKIRALFEELVELDAESQTARLDAADIDAATREAVAELLEADSRPHRLLRDEHAPVARLLDETDLEAFDPAEWVGREVGPYRLESFVGAGGMGRVYRAARVDGGFEQTVALKILHPGARLPEVVARFDAERSILASLEHPHIARLLDGGLTDDGLPYYTMEFVAGRPITDYCRDRGLGLRERMTLFADVCQAVQHAQERSVVHRDLKPSNVLVRDDGQVKLLDFGIAKILGSENADHDLTRTGNLPMTPGYAAPEQIRGEVVTTAVDVHALGVLLYELLCDRRPFETEERTPLQVQQDVLETSPPPVSRAAMAGAPRVEWARGLRGELDHICAMALRKEVERRYRSAAELLEDIRAWLERRPVRAQPDSLSYRSRKFLDRHRLPVSIAALGLLAIAALTLTNARRLARERDLARMESAQAAEVTRFMTEVFATADPNRSQGEQITARKLLDDGAQRIAERFADQPRLQARLQRAMATAYRGLGLFEESLDLLHAAESAQEIDPTTVDSSRVSLMSDLALTYESMGRSAVADSLLDSALALATHARPISDVLLADLQGQRGVTQTSLGNYVRAESLLVAADESWQRLGLRDHLRSLINRNNLALCWLDMSRPQDARREFERLVPLLRREGGPHHPELATTLYNLADVLRRQGEFEHATEIMNQVLAVETELYGDQHPNIAFDHSAIGNLQFARGEFDAARSSYQQALDIFRSVDPDYPQVPVMLSNLGRVAMALEDYDRADSLFERSLRLHRRIQGEQHPYVPIRLNDIGRLRRRQGRLEESRDILEEARRRNLEIWGGQHSQVAQSTYLLVQTLTDLGKFDRAEQLSREALHVEMERNGILRAETADIETLILLHSQGQTIPTPVLTQARGLARVLGAEGKSAASDSLFALVLDEFRDQGASAELVVASCAQEWASDLEATGRPEDALELLDESARIRLARLGPEHPATQRTTAERDRLRKSLRP